MRKIEFEVPQRIMADFAVEISDRNLTIPLQEQPKIKESLSKSNTIKKNLNWLTNSKKSLITSWKTKNQSLIKEREVMLPSLY